MLNYCRDLPLILSYQGTNITFNWAYVISGDYATIASGRLTFTCPAILKKLGENNYVWDALGNPANADDLLLGADELTAFVNGAINPTKLDTVWVKYFMRRKERIDAMPAPLAKWVEGQWWKTHNFLLIVDTWEEFESTCKGLGIQMECIQVKEAKCHVRRGEYDSVICPIKPIVLARTPAKWAGLPKSIHSIPGLVIVYTPKYKG